MIGCVIGLDCLQYGQKIRRKSFCFKAVNDDIFMMHSEVCSVFCGNQIGVKRQIRAKPNELNLLTGYRCIFSLLENGL